MRGRGETPIPINHSTLYVYRLLSLETEKESFSSREQSEYSGSVDRRLKNSASINLQCSMSSHWKSTFFLNGIIFPSCPLRADEHTSLWNFSIR